MVYLLALMVTLFFQYLSTKNPILISFVEVKENRCLLYKKEFIIPILYRVLVFLPFFLVGALRYNVGTDYGTYKSLQIPEVLSGNYSRVEFIYIPLIHILCGLLNNDQLFFAFIHLLIFGFTFLAIQKNSKNNYLSFVLLLLTGFFSMSINIMRQSIATAIVLYGLKYLEDKQYKHFLVFVFIACCFHKSAIVYLLFIMLYCLHFKMYVIPTTAIVCILFKDWIKSLFVFLISFTPYKHYVINYWWTTQVTSLVMIMLNIFVLLVMYMILYINFDLFQYEYFKKPKLLFKSLVAFFKTKIDDAKANFYIHIQITCTILSICTSIIPNATRVVYLFIPFQILTIPYFIENIKTRKSKVICTILVIIAFSFMFYRYFVIRNWSETFPYHSIFETIMVILY